MTAHPGMDLTKVSSWLVSALPNSAPPYEFELIAAGGSNLTYRVVDGSGTQWALRRPPLGRALATAHDMGREWKILVALAGDGSIPVPRPLAFCDDEAVTGARFYVMDFAAGVILRDSADATILTAAQAAAATDSLVDVQATLHDLDFEAAGLGDLGRHEGYVRRQLARWHRQVGSSGVRSLPLHGELHDRLVAAAPPDAAPALVHGDYRFDNCVLAEDWSVAAVLDWELATIGDPIADFAWSLRYWADAGDPITFLNDSPTLAPAFVTRADYQRRYQLRSGRDLSDLDYFEIFSWWKYASIVEGVYARRLAGSSGGMAGPDDPHDLAVRVDAMLAHAADLAGGVI